MKHHEELLVDYTNIDAHFASCFSGTLKTFSDCAKVYICKNKEKLTSVLDVSKNKSVSELTYSHSLEARRGDTFKMFLTFRSFLRIVSHFSTINCLCK